MLQQQLSVLRAREAQSQNPGQSAVMQHRLGEELVHEAKEAVAKAKAAKAAGDKAGCDRIMRHLKYTWHDGGHTRVPRVVEVPHDAVAACLVTSSLGSLGLSNSLFRLMNQLLP